MALTTRDASVSPERDDPQPTLTINQVGHHEGLGLNSQHHPLITIQASTSWRAFNGRELWAHRELLYFLTLRDLKVRYKQTLLGAFWIVMQPLLMTMVFTVFLGMVARISTPGIPYSVFVYSGLLPWMFISGGILGCSASLTGNANLLTKVYFPRVLLPAAYLGTRIVDFTISFVILLGLILVYRFVLHYEVSLSWKSAAVPFMVGLIIVFTLSVGILVASLNVKYRDIGVALPVVMQFWMFTSPIVYPPEQVPEKWQTLYSLNPTVGLIQGFRGALVGGKLPLFALAISGIITIILLVCAAFIFRHTEKQFADVV